MRIGLRNPVLPSCQIVIGLPMTVSLFPLNVMGICLSLIYGYQPRKKYS